MSSATLIQQARKLIREGRLAEARSLLRQVLSETPHNHSAWLLLARATPDNKLASRYIERAHLLQPDSPLVESARKNLLARIEGTPSRRNFGWRAAGIVTSVVLFAGLLAMIFSRNDWSQVIAMQRDSVAPAAAAASEPIAQENNAQPPPAAAGEFVVEEPAGGSDLEEAGEENLLAVTPTAVPTPEQAVDSDVNSPIAEVDNSEDDTSQPVVISDRDRALPAAIISGIEAEEAPQSEETTTEIDVDTSDEDDMVIRDSGPTANDDSETATVETADPGDFTVAGGAYGTLLPSGVAPGERWIDVNLTTQTLVAYEGEKPVLNSLISSGMWQFPTVTGQFRTWIKYDSQNMHGYHLGYDYYLPGVPYVMYFYEDYAIHGAYWHNNFGTPMSHGCVNMNTVDAGWLYNWAPLGTVVSVHS